MVVRPHFVYNLTCTNVHEIDSWGGLAALAGGVVNTGARLDIHGLLVGAGGLGLIGVDIQYRRADAQAALLHLIPEPKPLRMRPLSST